MTRRKVCDQIVGSRLGRIVRSCVWICYLCIVVTENTDKVMRRAGWGGGAPWFEKMCWPVKTPQERVAHAQSCGDNENKLERRPNGEGWLGGV
jgi:hypothetical protein